jgi:hydroxymethylpyrimidine pyrophosphatase-like HAD family hydrolase
MAGMGNERKLDPSAIRAIAIDLDGTTLLANSTIGTRTVECARRLLACGMHVIVCTGRAVGSSLEYCRELGETGPMVFFNGAVIADPTSAGGDIRLSLMPPEVAAYGAKVARDMDVHYQTFFPGPPSPRGRSFAEILVTEKWRPEAGIYKRHTGMNPTLGDIVEIAASGKTDGAIKSMFIADPSTHNEILERMTTRFGNGIYMTRTHPTYLEVMKAGVSKGAGLKTVMELRGLAPHEVIAFGDEENDLPMFEAVGFAAAPANAGENVRNAADVVVGPNTEEGVAGFLEETFASRLGSA